ncbi:MAG: molybdate ABC transporter substrate-binding protein [Nitrococcus sp.]|nr:molybdate ABC transporter substrate-binding protein [Nitrococcus sp.]
MYRATTVNLGNLIWIPVNIGSAVNVYRYNEETIMSITPSQQADRNHVRLGKPRAWALAVVFALAAGFTAAAANAAEVIVYAAASTTDALGEIAKTYEEGSDNNIKFSFASSSTLARQIKLGAPAQIYVSASKRWMDYVEKAGEILADTRTNLLANQLALVAPKDSKIDKVDIRAGFPIEDLLAGGKLAMGNPAHVPAGIYGKQALKSLDLWQKVEGQVARAADVRAALALVSVGGAPLGIVYTTDAAASDKVKIVGIFPADSHKAIVYPAALTKAAKGDEAAEDFFNFMESEEAASIFKQYGFKVLD